MLDLASFHTHELERLWLSPATPVEEKEAIDRELHLRDEDPARGPVVDVDGFAAADSPADSGATTSPADEGNA